MYYRQAELLATKSGLTTGTETVDIDVLDPISRIMIIVEATNADYAPDGHPIELLSGISVVDGSEVICSLTGRQAQAMAFFSSGKLDHNELNNEGNGVLRGSVSLYFGRWLYDEVLALAPKNFRNLQLKLQYNYAAAGCGLSSMSMRVLADMFDEKSITPVGYLLNKEQHKYAPSNGNIEYIVLPTDEILRMLVLSCPSDAEEPDVSMEDILVDEDDGKRVLVNAAGMDVIRYMMSVYPRFSEMLCGRAVSGGQEAYITASKDITLAVIGAQNVENSLYAPWSGGGLRKIYAAADKLYHACAEGACPHGSIPILFGGKDDIENWWDVTRVGKARLRITSRADMSSDTTAVSTLTSQLKRY